MEWTSSALVFSAIILVTLQAYSFFTRSAKADHVRLIGTLALTLAAVTLMLFLLFEAGSLVVSQEYGVVLVQGVRASFFLRVIVLVLALAAGFAVHAARSAQHLPNRGRWTLLAGGLVGVAAASRVYLLSPPTDPEPLRVYSYDIWWPIFAVWIVLCLSECIAASMGIRTRLERLCLAAFLSTALAVAAVRRTNLGIPYADRSSGDWWMLLAFVGVPLVMLLATRRALAKFGTEKNFPKKLVRIFIVVLTGLVGTLCSLLWIGGEVRISTGIVAVWVLAVGLLVSLRLYRGWGKNGIRVPDIGRPGRVDDVVVLVSLLVVVASLADIFQFASLNPVWDLAGLTFAWMLLLEIMVGAPLRSLTSGGKLKHFFLQELRLLPLTAAIKGGLSSFARHLAAALSSFFGKQSVGSAIVKVFLILIFLVAVAEIPNAGKTIVFPFDTAGLPGEDKRLGQLVTERVVNTLGLVEQELRPDLLVFTSSSDPRNENKPKLVSTAASEDVGSQAVVKNSTLELPGTTLSIPVAVLAAPIQWPMRRILGVRVIRGSVQPDGDTGGYIVLANASTGETWRARLEPLSRPPSTPTGNVAPKSATKPQKLSSAQPQVGAQKPKPARKEDQPASEPGTNIGTLQGLADQLAYEIVTSENSLLRAGMPSSWKALPPFRDGIAKWQEFKVKEDYVALAEAIEKFRMAVEADPNFALAQYRLGRALVEDQQLEAARTALQDSIATNPRFVAAQLALAQRSYDSWSIRRQQDLKAARDRDGSQWQIGFEERDEAARKNYRQRWHRVIQDLATEASPSDIATAYAGLCNDEITYGDLPEQRSEEHLGDSAAGFRDLSSRQSELGPARYLAFFHCRRAEQLYSRLSPVLRLDPQLKAAEANLLNDLGINFYRSGHQEEAIESSDLSDQRDWHCSVAHTIRAHEVNSTTPYARAALKYFERALAIAPEDFTIRCNLALTRMELGDHEPMRALSHHDLAHLRLANQLAASAESESNRDRAEWLYRKAIKEFQKAIDIAPSNLDARNNYGYTYWEWRQRSALEKDFRVPDAIIGRRAEAHAREATRLSLALASHAQRIRVQSTLGEVLLAQARPHEAIEVFDEIVRSDTGGLLKSPQFDEIWWDFGHAYLCAHSSDRALNLSDSNLRDGVSNAASYFEKIRAHERNREHKTFSDKPHELDADRPLSACISPARDAESETKYSYKLRDDQPKYSAMQACKWLGIAAEAPGSSERGLANLWLRVWGGGVDTEVALSTKPAHIILTRKPMAAHQYYFAQLQDAEGHLLSSTYSISTFPGCNKNRITLKFQDQSRPFLPSTLQSRLPTLTRSAQK